MQILAELESRHGQPEWLQTAFIKELYSCQFPAPGQGLTLSAADTTYNIAGEDRPQYMVSSSLLIIICADFGILITC